MSRMHEREALVRAAETKLRTALAEATEGLTEYESLRVVNGCASDYIGGIAKYGIREERHGNVNKPGGLE
jgi:hypothetical protein